MLILISPLLAQEEILPAFPGAEGHGKYVTGGRGGRIIYVTSLVDSNSPGSLRYAINQTGARTIMFKVSGYLKLTSKLQIKQGDITIAGQTAPGDGITLRDYPVTVDADNVIIRFMRFRMGDETAREGDALGGRYYKRIIIDHCSMSWSTDECVSFYQNENFTMQWSIISESLRNSVHGKGSHGYGGIWGGENASFHHNLLAHNDSRNPRFCGSRYSDRPDLELIDFRNNVIYNWNGNSTYGGEGGSYNIVNNYYKAGPATSSSKKSRIIQPYADDGSNNQPAGTFGIFYISGNYVTSSSPVTNNNWLGVSLHSSFSTYAPGVAKNNIQSETEFSTGEVTTHSAEDAYNKVLDYCGASFKRDSVDLRIINDVSSGSATFTDGGNGSKNGIIDTQSAVGGWPMLKSENAPVDTDKDGMPDYWELENGLNPESAEDTQLLTVNGIYPNIEVYLYSLVEFITESQNEGGISTSANFIKLNNEPIKIYWNSSTQELNISHRYKVKNVCVYSITGRLLLNKEFHAKYITIPVSNIQKGVLIIKTVDEQNQIFSNKILIF